MKNLKAQMEKKIGMEEINSNTPEKVARFFEITFNNILFNIEKEMITCDHANLFRDLKKLVPEFDDREMWFKS